ncbi:hypothetical protein [Streptomyces laurentii]|uniref:hypothetical protein n=1 Tax=Streptomyces laurentii TaxID=39478 RepID=UPI0033CFBFC6
MIRKLAEHDIGLLSTRINSFKFGSHSKWGSLNRETHLPREQHATLLAQLESGVEHSTKWAGIAIPSEGYIEVLVGPNQAPVQGSFLARRLGQLVSDNLDEECARHPESSRLPSLEFPVIRPTDRTPRIHLAGEGACLEISGPSPACHVLANIGFRETPRYTLSVRVFHDKNMRIDQLESATEPLLNSLMYELDVRNRLNIRPAKWPGQSDRRRPTNIDQPERIVRFPEIKVESEVSVLFGFAGSATGNSPLSFLSYYQVLENYFPVAGKRSALRKIELELTDPRFDKRSDKDLMRLLSVGENAAAASEATHLKTLLEEFVRSDNLSRFFTENDWGKHFTKQGPIKGITENINPENRQTPLAHQVAERVYRIRNRIVHAKDDPKYQNTPALLPQSDEAEALWPDIDLVRFLACEVILSAQVRSG